MNSTVCVMTSAHPPSDVRIFHKQCKSLRRAGYEVILVAPHAASELREGIELLAVRPAGSRLLRLICTTWRVYRTARQARADVYHFHDPELIPVGLLLRARGKPVIYDVHEDLPCTLSYKPYLSSWLIKPLAKVIDWFERHLAQVLSALVVATPEIAERFRSHPTVVVVQNYPRLEEFQAGVTASKETSKPPHVVYVGLRITRARGAVEMVRAMGLLPESLDVRLKLAGKIEPPELLNELPSLDGWKKTDYLGMLDRQEIASLVRGASAGLVVLHPEPNYVTAHPVKLFEYMCAGIPVIASDFPVCRQVILPSDCGLLVDPQSPRQIAAAINFLCSEPQRAVQMGRQGMQAVLTRYNWSVEEKKLLDVYRRLCDTPIFNQVKAEAT